MQLLTLESLRLENFKCHRFLEVNFLNRTKHLSGPPGWGGTSLLDGWCWLLYGKDLDGSTLREIRPLNSLGKLRDPQALTQVTGVIRFDGTQKELRRCLHRTPEGSWTTDFYLDGVPCRKSYYQEKIREMVPEKVFYLLSRPDWFLRNLHWQDQRNLILELLADKNHPDGDGNFRCILNTQKQLKEERLRFYRACDDLPYRISEMEGTMRQMGIPDFKGISSRRNCLHNERKALMAENPADLSRLELLNDQIAQLDQILGRKTMVVSGAKRLLKLREDLEKTAKWKKQLERRERDLSGRMEEKAEDMREGLKRLCPRFDLRFLPKEEGFTLLRGGIPVRNLSAFQSFLAGMDLIKVFSEHYGLQLPLLMDGLPYPAETFTAQSVICLSEKDRKAVEVF